MSFLDRLSSLPTLGLGVSTEYGAGDAPSALDPLELRGLHPEFASFLEIGVETAKGLDPAARAWLATGAPCTYHFLDLNLDEPEDFDALWLEELHALAAELRPAWLCGDAGLWHFGPRDRAHMLLLPPVLTDSSASALASGVARLREASGGYEVLPENPPGVAFPGDLHLLDFFARVVDRADSGMLLDCAHLAIYQRMAGCRAIDGLDGFPLERVVELHVAGGVESEVRGFRFVEDLHGNEALPETWEILDFVVPRAKNLRAVVHECERNTLVHTLPGFERIRRTLERSGTAARPPSRREGVTQA
jgi:uncharacterized protein (UPF0276 family)